VRLATVTLNGTLDRVLLVPGLTLGQIHSVERVITLASGKGLNVARTAHTLGAALMTTGLVAGQCGQWICAALAQEGIPGEFVTLPCGESRISTILVEPGCRQTTVVNDLGPVVAAELWPELCTKLIRVIRGYPWVALCGSGLPGLPDTVYTDLCVALQSRGQRVCLDTRAPWLTEALAARPYLVKCNQHEVAQVLGRGVDTPQEARDAAREWVAMGVERVVITLGSQGAVAVQEAGAWYVQAARVRALSPIGSGDAMMAGVILALQKGQTLPEAVRYGVALGTANTLAPGSGRCDWDAVDELMDRTLIHLL